MTVSPDRTDVLRAQDINIYRDVKGELGYPVARWADEEAGAILWLEEIGSPDAEQAIEILARNPDGQYLQSSQISLSDWCFEEPGRAVIFSGFTTGTRLRNGSAYFHTGRILNNPGIRESYYIPVTVRPQDSVAGFFIIRSAGPTIFR